MSAPPVSLGAVQVTVKDAASAVTLLMGGVSGVPARITFDGVSVSGPAVFGDDLDLDDSSPGAEVNLVAVLGAVGVRDLIVVAVEVLESDAGAASGRHCNPESGRPQRCIL